MLIGFDEFLLNFLQIRIAWLGGILGSGKTLLSFAIAEALLRRGLVRGVVANLPNKLPVCVGAEDGTLFNRAVIFDEAWTMLDARDSLVNDREYGAFARKIESYWLFPSVHMIDKRMRAMTVRREGRYVVPIVGEIWLYRWSLELGYETEDDDGGTFALLRPSQWFGVFDTKYVPIDDGGIKLRWLRTMDRITDGQGPAESQRVRDYLHSLAQLGGLEAVDAW